MASKKFAVTNRGELSIISVKDDGSTSTYVLEAGTHAMEMVDCPTGRPCQWLVLEGTKIGSAIGWWRDLSEEPETSDFHVDIKEVT